MNEELDKKTGESNGAINGVKKGGKPPFQLCFAATKELGRSKASKPKLPMNASLVTPKFYSTVDLLKDTNYPLANKLLMEIDKIKNQGPREKFSEPLLESHRYGWNPKPLVPMDKTDRIYNHHRMTSEMVKIQGILHNAQQAEREFEKLLLRKSKPE